MKNLLLTLSCLLLICLTPLASANLSNTPWIPPTNANSRITTANGTVHEMNYSSNYNFVGTGSITITGSNNSKTVYFNGASPPVNNHQGTYNQTLANNVVKNSGGRGLNFINGTNNPIVITNDPTRNQVNITISSTGSGGGGVTSLNALIGALNIVGVTGNTTATTSGGNTITINTAFNIVTTGGSAQVITKGLTLNALTLGGNAAGGNKNFTGLNQVNATRFYQNGNQVIDTLNQGSGISITGSDNSRTISNTGVLSAVTSINSQTGPAISITRQPSYTTITNNTNSIKVGIDAAGVMELNGTQTATGGKTFSGGITMSGSDINLGTNALTNSGHKSTLPLTSGTLCQTNQSSVCGSGLTSAITSINSQTGPSISLNRGSVTNMSSVTNSSNVISYQLKNNIVLTNGSAQTIAKAVTHTATLTMSSANFNIGTGNNVSSTNYHILQPTGGMSFGNGFLMTPTGSATPIFGIAPFGTGHLAALQIFRNNTFQTNYESLVVGSDVNTANEYAITENHGGTGVSRPVNFYMFTTKLFSMNVANTISYYVQQIWTPIADVTGANAIWKSSTTTDVLKYRNAADSSTLSIVSTISATNATRGQLSGNGTGTASSSMVMDGVYATITPANTGRITVYVTGVAADSVATDGCNIGIRQGTSNMGANGAAVAGTILGDNFQSTSATAAAKVPFSRIYDFTGTVGTKYFFDLSFSRVTGGTCTITSVNWDLVEH